VDSVRVIIRDVIPDQATQMTVVDNYDVIQKFFPTAFDPAFGNSVLPMTRGTYAYGLHPSGREEIGHIVAKPSRL